MEQEGAPTGPPPALATTNLTFHYPGIDGRPIPGVPPVVRDLTLALPPGARCLLVGANGAGKTTLLRVLGGKHLVKHGAVQVLGQDPFQATELTASGQLTYLGGQWARDIAFAGYSIPLQVSDGQRRRVQICLGLLHPFRVLLLDEITVDLDVLGRADLFRFLEEDTRERGGTIVYATHIFDGMDAWPSHIALLAGGTLKVFKRAEELRELKERGLLRLVERWLREEKKEREERAAAEGGQSDRGAKLEQAAWNNGWVAGRMTASLKGSSNAEMRM